MLLEYEENLNLKKCYTDELRFSFFKAGYFEPKYNYFKPDEKTLEIRIEIPGNADCTVKHRIEKEENIITVKGIKIKDSVPENPKDNLFNIREFSDFEIDIPLKVQDFNILRRKKEDKKSDFINGVYIIKYELVPKIEEEKASTSGL